MTTIVQLPPLHRTTLLGAGIVIIAAGLNAAAPIVNVVLISGLLAMTVYPLLYFLTQRGVGRGLAVLIVLLLVMVGGTALVLLLAASLARMVQELPRYAPAFDTLVDRATDILAARGIALDEALKPNPQRALAAVQRLAAGGLSALGNSIFVLVLIALFLIEMPLRRDQDEAPGSVGERLDDVAKGVRRFVGLNGVLGAAVALIDLLVMLALGTDFPVTWAVVCFLFAFVPFGFLLSLIPPFLITVLEQGLGRGLLLFGLFFVINTLVDNVIKPKIMGEGLGITPLMIILSLLFWAFILGPVGALLAIPLTIAIHKTLPILTAPSAQ